MKITFDPEANAAYFYVGGAVISNTEEVAPDIILDFDNEGRVVGIEVLNARERLVPGDWSQAPAPDAPQIEAAE